MNNEKLNKSTIQLLEVLGELTPDVEINNAITAMAVACCRIRRLQEELDNDGWISTKEELPGEDDGKVLILFGDPFFSGYSPEIECAYYEDGVWRFWLNNQIVSTDGVTDWQRLPTTKPKKKRIKAMR